jgi:hypothetical protein
MARIATAGYRRSTSAAGSGGKSTVPADRLGRFRAVDEARQTWGELTVQPLLEAALSGDDLALEVVEDLGELGGAASRALVRRALDDGVEAVPDAPDSLRRLLASLDHPPSWVDFEQLRRGSIAYFRGGPILAFVLSSAAVAALERTYGMTRPIVFTGRQGGDCAAMRAQETTRWVLAAIRPDGMRRDSEGFKLTVEVRLLHAMTRRELSRSPAWEWDEWGVPLADLDGGYAIAYDFAQSVTDALAAAGVRHSARELDDIFALWRYVGHVIGVPDHLLPGSPATAREFSELYLALDRGPDLECRRLYDARIRFAAGLGPEPVDMFPAAVARLLTPARRLELLHGLTRSFAGRRVADALGVPDTRWKHALALVRPAMGLLEAGRALGVVRDERLAAATIRRLEVVTAAAAL